MSRPEFDVRTTPRFDRLLRSLNRRHADLAERFAIAIEILRLDPYNHSREHLIRKLEGVRQGAGQYRLRLGRWRFRYDIYDREVVLHSTAGCVAKTPIDNTISVFESTSIRNRAEVIHHYARPPIVVYGMQKRAVICVRISYSLCPQAHHVTRLGQIGS